MMVHDALHYHLCGRTQLKVNPIPTPDSPTPCSQYSPLRRQELPKGEKAKLIAEALLTLPPAYKSSSWIPNAGARI